MRTASNSALVSARSNSVVSNSATRRAVRHWGFEIQCAEPRHYSSALTAVRPMDHFGGLHIEFPAVMAAKVARRLHEDGIVIAIDAHDKEFEAWRWVPARDLPALIVPFTVTWPDATMSIQEMINEGVRRAYANPDNPLRASVLADPDGKRVSTKDNTPAVVHVEMVPGDTVEYHVIKMARKKNMWWFRGEAKVAGHVVAEAEVGARL